MRRLFFTILFMSSCSALAAEAPVKAPPIEDAGIDFKAVIMQIDGKTPVPVENCEPAIPGKKCEPLTLQKVCEDAMIAQNIQGDTPTPEEKGKRFWLAQKIHNGKRILTVDELALLKKVIGIAYGPLVIGRTTELLDPASVPKN